MFQLKADDPMDMMQSGMDAEQSGMDAEQSGMDACGMYDPNEDFEQNESTPGELTESQKANIRELYEKYDKDKSGTLSSSELRKCLQVLGLNPTTNDVKRIMSKHDVGPKSKGKKKVTYEVFEQIMKEELPCLTSNEFELMEAFRLFDHDKNDSLDKDELKKCLTCLGECLTDEEVDALFKELDTDGNGVLSVKEAAALLA